MRTLIRSLITCAVALLCMVCVVVEASAQSPKEFAVMVSATVKQSPTPSIILSWDKDPSQQVVYVFRKTKETARFPSTILDSVVGAATTWADNNVKVGESFEYRLLRSNRKQTGKDSATGNPIYAEYFSTGYIHAGILAPPAPRERALVLVDETLRTSLASELATFQADLENEGWDVTIRNVPRAEKFDSNGVKQTRAVIKEEWDGGPKDIGSIVLVGRVAVPYSGTIYPDGHPDHVGAWPADGIYGDHNGSYTDRIANQANTSRPANNNVPGDGKFDQSQFATDVDIPVGRIDFYNLPAFTKSELELLRAYFKKNHEYRSNQWNVAVGGVIDDNFGTYGEVFAASAWRTFPVFGGESTVRAGDIFTDLAGPNVYLLAYGCGGGTDVSAGGVGSSTDMTTKPVNAVFTMMFGSYFGDWDTKNNFMRSTLASNPRVLTCGWSGRPHWYIHHMALGETIGYGAKLSQNNQTIVGGQLGNYIPNIFVRAQGNSIASAGDRQVHIALMGDPTLRATTKPIPSVATLTAATEYPNIVNLTWNSPGADAAGYLVYRRKAGTKKWTQLTPTMITKLTFKDSLVNDGTLEYMVKTLAVRELASGSYHEMGKGRIASVITTDVAEGSTNTSINIAVGPNPASTSVNIALSLGVETPVSIEIIDITGSILQTQRFDALSIGSHNIGFDVSNMAAGTYRVVVRVRNQSLTQPLTIIR
ncbi:MAG: T9SS type A sorting domain-containing protein [Ignavibacteria bacterium]|jgi:hypothetical protein